MKKKFSKDLKEKMFRIFELMTSEQEIKQNADYYNNIVNKLSETVNSSNNENKEEELNEYFYKEKSRADIKKTINGTVIQFFQHLLIRNYCINLHFSDDVLNHWGGELKGFITSIRNKSKDCLKDKFIREIIIDNNLNNTDTLFTLLYEKIEKENKLNDFIPYNKNIMINTCNETLELLNHYITFICDTSIDLNNESNIDKL